MPADAGPPARHPGRGPCVPCGPRHAHTNAHSALPSLFGACHEEPADPGGKGFSLWPRTKWIWSFQLTLRSGNLLTKLHRGKSLYLTAETARAFDPLIRGAIAEASGDDETLLRHLAKHGASSPEDIELELGWQRQRLKAARNRLERIGGILSHGLVFEDPSNYHVAPLRRWDQVCPASRVRDPIGEIVVAGVRAAVTAPERDVPRWFSCTIPPGTIERLVASGRLSRPAPGWLCEGKD